MSFAAHAAQTEKSSHGEKIAKIFAILTPDRNLAVHCVARRSETRQFFSCCSRRIGSSCLARKTPHFSCRCCVLYAMRFPAVVTIICGGWVFGFFFDHDCAQLSKTAIFERSRFLERVAEQPMKLPSPVPVLPFLQATSKTTRGKRGVSNEQNKKKVESFGDRRRKFTCDVQATRAVTRRALLNSGL
jgi:hypothetical protein